MIDDLTIQNKKLKKRLKKYEAPHCAHLQEEKLFEVRFHGLPAHKKRELDDLLRGFAASIEEAPKKPSSIVSRHQLTSLPDPLPPTMMKKSSSSTTSNSRPVDSAYASISNSGQTQTSYSQANDKSISAKPTHTTQSKQENVNSYLDDIPQGLMPRHSLVMSEQSKRKLVVKRLEELFSGKGAARSEHCQSHQQQEVSLSAAKADQGVLEAGGCKPQMEGLRESRISAADTDTLNEHMSDASLQSLKELNDGDRSTSRGIQVSQDSTPDQRPTRPLDLDLYRAQVPGDNLEYIRHLGLASPTSKTDPYTNNANTVDEWVYLNLLVNMAQLHTFNVTPEFIRKSVMDISTKLELSQDGRKIRWKGGAEEPKGYDDSDSSTNEKSGSLVNGHREKKRRKLGGSSWNTPGHDITADLSDVSQCSSAISSVDLWADTNLKPISLEPINDASKFSYKPMFYRGTSSEEEDDAYDDGPSGVDAEYEAGEQLTFNTRRGNQTRSTREKKGETGPVIFYNKANFCTDLSGDLRTGLPDSTAYSPFLPEPVGSIAPKLPDRESSAEEPKGPITESYILSQQMGVDEGSRSVTESLLTFAGTEVQSDETVHPVPIRMEASGLSGVQLMDHFSIEVQVQNKKMKERIEQDALPCVASRAHANRLFSENSLPAGPSKVPLIQSTIVSTSTKRLRPSSLPPPSYINLHASSSGETDSCYESELMSESQTGRMAWPNSTADDDGQSAQPMSSLSSFEGTRKESLSNSSSAVGSDDSSIDLLAHARELDPEAIAAREREFDRNVSQQIMETQADSSAATAGGRSGDHSEGSEVEEVSRSSQDSGSSAERRRSIHGSSPLQRQPTLERYGSDEGNSDVDALFTSSGMEESD